MDRTNSEIKEIDKSSKKEFNILLKICLITGIIIISGFIIYEVLKPEPGYVTFGILNENQAAENYPTEAFINENISFYLTVENYLDRNFSYQIQIKKGDNMTIMNPNIGSNGTLNYTIGNFTLKKKQSWLSEKLDVSFSVIGENQIIIAELWQIKETKVKFYNILWLRLNITS
ncbi:MAG: DUF1616 domain-containing protein [Candidatus Hodarchaeota archaeon]